MGNIQKHRPVLLIEAAFSRHLEALDWAREQGEKQWGEIVLQSERFDHNETNYYEATMGEDLKKQFFAFEKLIDPARLVDWKLQAIRWEEEYRESSDWSETRPLNLDPGYLTEAKLVLASTKDRDHRIYLERGIYAEGTLYFHRGHWQKRPWTYPDYQRSDYHQFFTLCRDYLRRRYRDDAAK